MEFFRDKKKKFECNIMVDGANMTNTSARMLLEFKDQTLLFRGKVDSTGKCTIEIPALKNVFEDGGKATLEVIADSTVFEPWKSDFILKESKTVKVVEMEEIKAEEPKEEKIKVKVEVDDKPEPKIGNWYDTHVEEEVKPEPKPKKPTINETVRTQSTEKKASESKTDRMKFIRSFE